VAEAAFATAQGFTHPVDQVRIETAAAYDPLAAQALAMRARSSLIRARRNSRSVVSDSWKRRVQPSRRRQQRRQRASQPGTHGVGAGVLPARDRAAAGSSRSVQPLAGPRPRLPGGGAVEHPRRSPAVERRSPGGADGVAGRRSRRLRGRFADRHPADLATHLPVEPGRAHRGRVPSVLRAWPAR
jgi:hypothetical protein